MSRTALLLGVALCAMPLEARAELMEVPTPPRLGTARLFLSKAVGRGISVSYVGLRPLELDAGLYFAPTRNFSGWHLKAGAAWTVERRNDAGSGQLYEVVGLLGLEKIGWPFFGNDPEDLAILLGVRPELALWTSAGFGFVLGVEVGVLFWVGTGQIGQGIGTELSVSLGVSF